MCVEEIIEDHGSDLPQRSPRLCGKLGFEKKSVRIFLGDQIPIQRSVLDGFGEVGRLDVFLAFEVGNGRRDL